MLKGSCLCGAVTYTADGEIGQPAACHCTQCRKQSGHVWASAWCAETDLTITGDVRWYHASPTAKRGFCPTCGSVLFWKAQTEDTISFSAGSIDGPTGLNLRIHIFTADKGDYYDIADGVPQREN
ncbi:GFA family protein [Mesobacterium sp. TK19101]|uniref:GFA family protein n=1 Tax=Mesobacterium hydrothermale TaxID=3111907 RepID=A0ABU6HEF5_9RHOB|nr:GFA family protein [Mesobacterium sp. TK19101]MEC3860848.1 GFA family protein [Mesobacterium sp. TK19101]